MFSLEKYFIKCQAAFDHSDCERVKVVPQSLPGLFFKLEYLETEFKKDYGIYAIV